mmetsp:Transcript_16777/g.34649  ORF Transcript_16777/g.34649 Transcript_16777/m.34649 type:complete len:210 (+) Transcript_16777:1250-1879(+)
MCIESTARPQWKCRHFLLERIGRSLKCHTGLLKPRILSSHSSLSLGHDRGCGSLRIHHGCSRFTSNGLAFHLSQVGCRFFQLFGSTRGGFSTQSSYIHHVSFCIFEVGGGFAIKPRPVSCIDSPVADGGCFLWHGRVSLNPRLASSFGKHFRVGTREGGFVGSNNFSIHNCNSWWFGVLFFLGGPRVQQIGCLCWHGRWTIRRMIGGRS